MELTSSNIKKILAFSQRKLFLYSPKRKLFLYFPNKNFLALFLKNFTYFLKRKTSLYKKDFLIFLKTEPCTFQPKPLKINKRTLPRENLLCFRKRKPQKNFLVF